MERFHAQVIIIFKAIIHIMIIMIITLIMIIIMIIIMMIITVFIITIRNGDSWHPTVVPWGEMVCVDCTCKVNIAENHMLTIDGDAVTLYLQSKY